MEAYPQMKLFGLQSLFLSIVTLALFGATLSGYSVFAESAVEIRLSPHSDRVSQGHSVYGELHSEKALPVFSSVTLGRLHARVFYDSAQSAHFLMGVPIDHPPQTANLSFQGQAAHLEGKPIQIAKAWYPSQNITVGKATAGLQPLPGELEAVQQLKERLTEKQYWHFPLLSPTPHCMISPFGVKRYHNGVYTKNYHKGVDLRSPYGFPVKAISGGMVRIAAPHFRLHGGTVGLDHGQGLSSIYIHLSKVLVQEGEMVKAGETVGLIGATGFASGPHLHWGLYANGTPVNPLDWIPVSACR
jgi:murein DD-endopeptidase MepM/ murein hydrolase activator NlpD